MKHILTPNKTHRRLNVQRTNIKYSPHYQIRNLKAQKEEQVTYTLPINLLTLLTPERRFLCKLLATPPSF